MGDRAYLGRRSDMGIGSPRGPYTRTLMPSPRPQQAAAKNMAVVWHPPLPINQSVLTNDPHCSSHFSLKTNVAPSFKGKTECIDHVCARIKLYTLNDIVNTKISATRIKSYYKTQVLNET
jgi:hypothetical protein